MSVPAVKFNRKDQPEFIKELRKRVNAYFRDNNISRFANARMVFKTVFMILLYFTPLVLMLTGVVSSLWPVLLMWALMGFGMSGIGLSIMHDAIHGSYSRHAIVNKSLGWLINLIGGFHTTWKIQHNVLHHSFTNVHEHDEDIITPALRLSPDQERKRIFRYQAFYAPFIYSIMTIYWSFAKDWIQLIRYRKKDLLRGQGLSFSRELASLALNKAIYFTLLLILPLILIDLPWYQILLGFLIMQLICGTMLALIFQPAHVIEETQFFATDEAGSVENSWAIHQVLTTANFARKSRFFSWFIGGLNYQIEHHLFPNICHVHYRQISDIIKQTAEEFKLPYHSHRTFYHALKSHFTLLHHLGTGKYDQMLAPQRVSN